MPEVNNDILITGEQRLKFLTLHNKLKEALPFLTWVYELVLLLLEVTSQV